MPVTRCCDRACEETSITTDLMPPSTRDRNCLCKSGASGVVSTPVKVPIDSQENPAVLRIAVIKCVVVVFPFVPVTPTTFSSLDGNPK